MKPSFKKTQQKNKEIYNKLQPQAVPPDTSLSKLINLLKSVNCDSKEAKLNAMSINNNNGGRILL